MNPSVIDLAEFTSVLFRPLLPDESQVNPGAYGAELAYWLCFELARCGVVTSYPEYEDWGWFIQYLSPSGSEFDLRCTNAVGTDDRWQLSLLRHGRKAFGRDKPPFSEASQLMAAIKSLLERTDEISHLRWLQG